MKVERCFCLCLLSLPVRECGLKSLLSSKVLSLLQSLPVRECGLKSNGRGASANYGVVTPRAGVWIEIAKDPDRHPGDNRLLPVRECGLKYCSHHQSSTNAASLPVRECGLKYQLITLHLSDSASLPVRECGLK